MNHPTQPPSNVTELKFEEADAHLDLRGTPCPINFVRTKLRLEQMSPGSRLEVWLDAGEPVEQVPDSLAMEGYQIENIESYQGFFSLLILHPLKS
ncbi:MAG: sulfurtransferase TusA family protein [Pleurocapsa sp.]